MDILVKLFGSSARIKILRLFLFNSEESFSIKEVTDRARITPSEAKKEVALLLSIGLIKKKAFSKEVNVIVRKKPAVKKIKGIGYALDGKFPYLTSLKNLLITVSLHDNNDLVERFSKAGRLKLVIVAGVFIQDWESRVDLLIVADGLNISKLDGVIKNLESEIGKEIRYSAFETPDFEYRIGIYDKLVRDILDFPHMTLVDRIDIEGK